MWRTTLLVLLAACSSSHHARHRELAQRLLARADHTSGFGPASEYLPSDLPEVGATGMFETRPLGDCDVAILHGGEASFTARMKLLADAKQSIRIEALIFTGDESGLRVAEVLKEKKAAGLDVRVIVDGISNLSMQTQWMYFDLKQHGIEVQGYEALGLQVVGEIPIPFLTPERTDPNKRYHEKLWIIDAGTPNARAVTGGLNIANEYFRIDPTNIARYWRDQDVIVRGAVIADLATTFDRNYDHFVNLKQKRGGMTDAAWDAARKIMEKTGKPAIGFTRDDNLVKTVAAFEARASEPAYQAGRCRFFQSRPRLHETFIQQAYLKLLASAKKEVLIANAYFVPPLALRMAVERAARRCVRIVMLTNGSETSDTPGMSLTGRGYYNELVAINKTLSCEPPAGVEIWEWQGKAPSDAKQTQGLLHAKYAVVDREIALVGSYNLDPRSEQLNSESAIVFENPTLAGELARIFSEEDLATSRRIPEAEAATYEKPASVRQRFKKDFAGLFEDLL